MLFTFQALWDDILILISLEICRMWIPARRVLAPWPFLLLRLIGRDIIRGSLTSCDFSHVCCQGSLPPSAWAPLSLLTLGPWIYPWMTCVQPAILHHFTQNPLTHVILSSSCLQKMWESRGRSDTIPPTNARLLTILLRAVTLLKGVFLKIQSLCPPFKSIEGVRPEPRRSETA